MSVASAAQERYVALLRGINLGSRNRVPMAGLREICEQAGCTDVKTYIASGNVVVTSRLGAKALAVKLQNSINDEFGISISVVVLTAKQLATAIQRNPFASASPNSLYVAFAAGPISKADVDRLANLDIAPEGVLVRGRLIYLHMPNGYGRSGLAGEVSRVKVPTTVRNWRTITALNEIAAAP